MKYFFQNATSLISIKTIPHLPFFQELFYPSEPAPTEPLANQLQVDTHAHWLPGVDDGAQTTEEALQMVRGLSKLGYQKLIATPHIMVDRYQNDPAQLTDIFESFRQKVKMANIPVELQLGAEYMLDEGFTQHLQNGPLLTLQGKLVLLEMSRFQVYPRLREILFELQLKGYVPVLAHPERYTFYHQKHREYEQLKEAGCLFQLNLLSLQGSYGDAEERAARFLLRQGWYDLAGTDLHRPRQLEKLSQVTLSGSFKNAQLS